VNFSYTEEQLMLQSMVQKFVQKDYDFDTRNKIVASDKGYSEDNWQTFAELGWLSVPFTEEDGGFGGSAVDLIVMMEEFGKAILVEPFVPTAVFCGALVSSLGNDSQKADLIEKIMGGSLQLACAHVEQSGRYNPASISTTAATEGDSIVLNGEKISVLNGANADKLLVVARESGETTAKEGVSVFIVDASNEGVGIQSYTNVDGKNAAKITLTSVKISVDSRLGAAGKALPGLESGIDRATLAVCAEAVGSLEALLKKTVEYSKTRKQFGTPIGTFQALQHRMADMFIECQLARSIVIMAAMSLDSNDSDAEKSKAISAAKSRIGKAIRKVGQESIQIHGGIGVTNELDISHLFKSVTALDVMFGNSDYHTKRFSSL
jgi:alkylation response protein AidB-like acyl-CoA dehydrogenase|tara:strand:+ start:1683 stop:2816 length:1134 start_codon:yes stop_codon:yes gene_type:complete